MPSIICWRPDILPDEFYAEAVGHRRREAHALRLGRCIDDHTELGFTRRVSHTARSIEITEESIVPPYSRQYCNLIECPLPLLRERLEALPCW